jgi:signal transduction histidine kinase
MDRSMTRDLTQQCQPTWEEVQTHVDHIAHEMRAPLGVVQEYAALLGEGYAGSINDEQAEFIERIQRRVDGLLRLVDDLLDVSRLRAGWLAANMQLCHVTNLLNRVRQVLGPHAVARQQRLRFQVADSLPEVLCDADQITRVIINLGMNAIKFAPVGGEVTLSAERDRVPGRITIRVRDNGPGMSGDQQRMLFERFHQCHTSSVPVPKGFGLGLHIAKELLAQHNTTIELESRPGHGTDFWFTLNTIEPPSSDSNRSHWQRHAPDPSARRGSSECEVAPVAVAKIDGSEPSGPKPPTYVHTSSSRTAPAGPGEAR